MRPRRMDPGAFDQKLVCRFWAVQKNHSLRSQFQGDDFPIFSRQFMKLSIYQLLHTSNKLTTNHSMHTAPRELEHVPEERCVCLSTFTVPCQCKDPRQSVVVIRSGLVSGPLSTATIEGLWGTLSSRSMQCRYAEAPGAGARRRRAQAGPDSGPAVRLPCYAAPRFQSTR